MSRSEPNVEFYGDWDSLQGWFAWLAAGGHVPAMEEALGKIGVAVKQALQQHILNQDLPWAPLSDRTVRKKGHDTIYIETGRYVNSIETEVNSEGLEAAVSIFPTGKYSDGTKVDKVAFDMEFGTSRMPSRPLWRRVAEEMLTFQEVVNIPLEEILGLK